MDRAARQLVAGSPCRLARLAANGAADFDTTAGRARARPAMAALPD